MADKATELEQKKELAGEAAGKLLRIITMAVFISWIIPGMCLITSSISQGEDDLAPALALIVIIVFSLLASIGMSLEIRDYIKWFYAGVFKILRP